VKRAIANPVNDTQREFNHLCELGGGRRSGPAEIRVKELLRSSGKKLNAVACKEVATLLQELPTANPWHVCFAMGLSWGHLAKLEIDFVDAAARALRDLNDADLRDAARFHLERGPEPIQQALKGGYSLFQRVTLPTDLADSLERLWRAQERWLSPILGPDRPRYIGSWNATAMFMCALFARPKLAAIHIEPKPLLPPGGPIFAGLQILSRTGVILRSPAGSELDDQSFEPGALYENNSLFVEILKGLDGWGLVDVHSGVYMLGTRHPLSNTWA
jgi:hypothetical protein